MKNLGCYNSTPLKRNLVLEIWKTVIKEMYILRLWIFSTFSSSLILQFTIPRCFACRYNLTPNNLLIYFQNFDRVLGIGKILLYT
jgi:hypothetical protein